MPYTVAVSFDRFRQSIEPPSYQRETATKRKNHLVSLLEQDFTILDAFAMGSLPKYTAVKGYADLDVMVVLHYGKHIKNRKPSEVLQAVRDCLGDYRTNVRKNGQAVTLYYKTWPNVDIVPVSRVTNSDGSVSHYCVPNMHDESWIKSQPRKHEAELSGRNSDFGVQFKRIIKMIKWWNRQHSSYLSSYHIEVLALNILTGTFSSYSWNTFRFFDKSTELVQTPLWHHLGYADSYLDSTKRQEALKRLQSARDKSRDAWSRTYGDSSDHKRAIEIWRQIFGDEFPAYG